jgi:predicted transcriptional regulator
MQTVTTTAKPKKDNKVSVNFRLHPRHLHRLTHEATKLRRTKTSILEQLIEDFCASKNLQP